MLQDRLLLLVRSLRLAMRAMCADKKSIPVRMGYCSGSRSISANSCSSNSGSSHVVGGGGELDYGGGSRIHVVTQAGAVVGGGGMQAIVDAEYDRYLQYARFEETALQQLGKLVIDRR